MAIVKIHISELKNFYGRDHFSGVTFCRSFFDGADVLTLREKRYVFILVSYIFETKNVD